MNLTSIEYDPTVGAAAAAAIAAAGYEPRLIIGDGLLGDRDNEDYDRLIATCAVRYIPLPWLHQVKPGGRILVTLSGWSYANALALLEVTGFGEATGRFLPCYTSFMIARPHDHPPPPEPRAASRGRAADPDRPGGDQHLDGQLGGPAGRALGRTHGCRRAPDSLGRGHWLAGADHAESGRRVERHPARPAPPLGSGGERH
ncbi:hypothetical protein ACIBCA_30020 [Kitasatospora sp. NPDC051170]|uniref:hypothetical protein n=1 Tax=Kitasatospora sp. NPDC051170 TaxID=3364056 RepID=UPI0037A74B29